MDAYECADQFELPTRGVRTGSTRPPCSQVDVLGKSLAQSEKKLDLVAIAAEDDSSRQTQMLQERSQAVRATILAKAEHLHPPRPTL